MRYIKVGTQGVFNNIEIALSQHCVSAEVAMASRYDEEKWSITRSGSRSTEAAGGNGSAGVIGAMEWWLEGCFVKQAFALPSNDLEAFTKSLVKEFGGTGSNENDHIRVCSFRDLDEQSFEAWVIVGISDRAQALLFKLKH